MDHELYSYRFSQEIIEHRNYRHALREILRVVDECPQFVFPNKSDKKKSLDTVQQLFNSFFDRRFACDLNWEYHPNATTIPNSGLAADYRKNFNGLRIQAEVQFGNMARWYSDIFKFQTAYSQGLIDMGLCIVPMSSLAVRMDSNITNYERCIRELPSAKLSITLPILLIGMYASDSTRLFDVSKTKFSDIKSITGKGNQLNRFRIINGFLLDTPLRRIGPKSPPGSFPSLLNDPDNLED